MSQAQRRSVAERFWEKVEKTDSCWIWRAALTQGYGVFGVRRGENPVRAHRWAYTSLVGPVPEGLVLDHLCRNRACVNPDHLQPVTQRENILRGEGAVAVNYRKTHCNSGHEFTPENTRVRVVTTRACRACDARKAKEARDRKKEMA